MLNDQLLDDLKDFTDCGLSLVEKYLVVQLSGGESLIWVDVEMWEIYYELSDE